MSTFTDDDDDYGDYRDDFWGRTPQSSYFEIAKTANQNVVENELEIVFRRLAVAERMLEERGLDDALEQEISATVIDQDIDGRTATVFIDLVASIVTKCE
jgi:Mg-chelatase subunit ChlI